MTIVYSPSTGAIHSVLWGDSRTSTAIPTVWKSQLLKSSLIECAPFWLEPRLVDHWLTTLVDHLEPSLMTMVSSMVLIACSVLIPGWSTIGWPMVDNFSQPFGTKPHDHGFFRGPDSLFHANMFTAQRGTSDAKVKTRKAMECRIRRADGWLGFQTSRSSE